VYGLGRFLTCFPLQRIQLMRQFKGSDWTLNDQFTITPEYLTASITYIKRVFAAMISKVHNQQQNQSGAQRPAAPQGPATTQPTTQTNVTPLNASNLQQLQQQEEALQRARQAQGQNVPAAPTVAQPPFPLGAMSPQGIPHAYGPGGFPPEKLKLPPAKKRKQTHPANATATPGQAQAPTAPASKTQPAKQAPADTKKAPPSPAGPFKCTVPECQYHQKGFTTQTALDKHMEESHKVEEQIADPLEYALESFRTSLVKEKEKAESQETRKVPTTSTDAQQAPNKPVAAAAAAAPVKPEVKAEGTTPATAGTTPMGRVPSQAGPKSTSPGLNQLQTPRMPSGKAVGAPSTLKPTPSKDGKKEAGKPGERGPSPEDAVGKDPWADSNISLEAIHDAFMDFGDENLRGLGFDPIDEFLISDTFTKIQSEDTPDSVDTGVATQTPKDSESSKDDDMDVKIGGLGDDNWIPVDWFSLPGRLEGGLLTTEPWEDLDWETIDRKEAEMNADDSAMAICAI